jgi:uncharacterized repeat protein (TIGR01451 family)
MIRRLAPFLYIGLKIYRTKKEVFYMRSKFLAVGMVLLLVGLLLSAGGCPQPEVCACLYSGMDGMEVLEGENWDINDPDDGTWAPVNIIPQGDANASDWGVRFPELPWSDMYDDCADWVYGNNDWESPVSNDHEYYSLPFTVPIDGSCVMVRFKAYIDDAAKFYIDGPGFSGPTLFYEHDPADSMYSEYPASFWVGTDAADLVCLGPGEYTIYIDHWDTGGVIYGLIFTAECKPCECPSPSIAVEKLVSADGGATWADEVEQYACQNVQFQITVTNNGGVPLTSIVISDALPDCLEYVPGSATPPPDSMLNNNLVWNFAGPLQPNASTEVIFSAHVVCAENCCDIVSVEGKYGVACPHKRYHFLS